MGFSAINFEGLVFREFFASDAAAFTAAALESIPTVGRWMPWCTSDYSEIRALDWFATCGIGRSAGTAFEYGIFCGMTGALLGGAGLNEIRQAHKVCNLGYWVRQSRHRQGVALRCVQALSAHGFRELGLQRVEIVVAVGNIASEGVAVKSTALRECVARNRLYLHDEPVQAHIFSLVPK